VWVKQFQDGRKDVTDDASSSYPTTSRTVQDMMKVTEMVRNNQ
jgi:hypothetical protein